MGIHSRHTRILAVVGVLALGAASAGQAQDTTSVHKKGHERGRSVRYIGISELSDRAPDQPCCGATAPASSTMDRPPDTTLKAQTRGTDRADEGR